jgi:flagellar M-ring protein FliF
VLGPDGLPLASTGQPSNYNKSDSTQKNAVDKVVEQTQTPPGAVTTQSVAVMLDAAHVPAERLPALQQSITAAAGIQAKRGDIITVTRVRFDDALAKQAKAELASSDASGKSTSMFSMLEIVVALIVVFVVLILLWRAMKRAAENRPPGRVPLDLSRLEMLDALALSAPTGLQLPVGASSQHQADVAALIDRAPDEVALTLRSWLSERGT